jgi:hypothetical protein
MSLGLFSITNVSRKDIFSISWLRDKSFTSGQLVRAQSAALTFHEGKRHCSRGLSLKKAF